MKYKVNDVLIRYYKHADRSKQFAEVKGKLIGFTKYGEMIARDEYGQISEDSEGAEIIPLCVLNVD